MAANRILRRKSAHLEHGAHDSEASCDERADNGQTNVGSVTWLARARSSANTVSTTTRTASGFVASDGGKRVGGVGSTRARERRVGVRLDVQVAHGDVVALADTLELRGKKVSLEQVGTNELHAYCEWRIMAESSGQSVANSEVDSDLVKIVLQHNKTG